MELLVTMVTGVTGQGGSEPQGQLHKVHSPTPQVNDNPRIGFKTFIIKYQIQ